LESELTRDFNIPKGCNTFCFYTDEAAAKAEGLGADKVHHLIVTGGSDKNLRCGPRIWKGFFTRESYWDS
jgi:hypothetical protein